MSCSVNSIKKFIVYIRPGCYFKTTVGSSTIFDSGDSNHGVPSIKNRYTKDGTAVKFFPDMTTWVPFPGIVSLDSDPHAGEMDVIESPIQDRKSKVASGIRTLPDLEFSFRVESPLDTSPGAFMGFFYFFAEWWRFRNLWNFDILIMISNRGYQHLYGYWYRDVTIGRFGDESMSIEDVKKAQIKLRFYPDNVILVDRCGNPIDLASTNEIPDNFIC